MSAADHLERQSFIENPLAFWLDPRRWDDINPNKEMFWDKDRPPLEEEPAVLDIITKFKEYELEHHSLDPKTGELVVRAIQNKVKVKGGKFNEYDVFGNVENYNNFCDIPYNGDGKLPLWQCDMIRVKDPEAVFEVDWDLLGMPYDMDSWTYITFGPVTFYNIKDDYKKRVRYLRRAKFPNNMFEIEAQRPWGRQYFLRAIHYRAICNDI